MYVPTMASHSVRITSRDPRPNQMAVVSYPDTVDVRQTLCPKGQLCPVIHGVTRQEFHYHDSMRNFLQTSVRIKAAVSCPTAAAALMFHIRTVSDVLNASGCRSLRSTSFSSGNRMRKQVIPVVLPLGQHMVFLHHLSGSPSALRYCFRPHILNPAIRSISCHLTSRYIRSICSMGT